MSGLNLKSICPRFHGQPHSSQCVQTAAGHWSTTATTAGTSTAGTSTAGNLTAGNLVANSSAAYEARSGLLLSLALVLGLSLFLGLALCGPAAGQSIDEQEYQKVVDQGIAFLRKSQNEDGSFSKELGPGITGMAVTALLKQGLPRTDETVAAGLKHLEKFVKSEDGGIYAEGSRYRNYETCIGMMCFAEANEDGRYNKTIERAKQFIKKIQWGIGESDSGSDEAAMDFGGAGYGSHNRPDLSNTSFFIDALKTAREKSTDAGDQEALEAALKFVSRTQNKYSEHNRTEFARKAAGEDVGGFYYTPAAGGESKAGETANGGLRSYASMTYAGLKSLLYAGVTKDDPRVVAAMEWISRHYDLDSNPGVGQQGLFYYYHIFGKAMAAVGEDQIVDGDGTKHDWRAELFAAIQQRQREDGSWINPESSRWEEGNPDLVTAYSLLALSYCKK